MFMLVLAIETSCDETSAAVVKDGREVLSNIINSQIDLHKKYGGVVPEIASRKHVELIVPVIDEALSEANKELSDIDLIAVTYGPGLVGALLVGLSAAKALALSIKKPLIGVNHIKGHIAANYIEDKSLEPPFISLVVSGGHSHIVYVSEYTKYEVMGRTRDDAAGEAFDKIARAIGLGYPGGPLIDKYSQKGDPDSIEFPRVRFKDGSLDFSFSGPKTAVLNYINKEKMQNKEINLYNISASFQKAVVDILVENTLKASELKGCNKICLAGGVAANSMLRSAFMKKANKKKLDLIYPSLELCTDNAAMIGCAAYYEYLDNNIKDMSLNAIPNLKI
jgi:N6-L-threonylcarbamoyladenine synthase